MNDPVRLIVLIPALNEQATIQDVIRRVPRRIDGIDEIDIVLIDDGSWDSTGELAAEAGALVVRHRANRGVGAAFQTGVETALDLGADYAVNMDGDGQFAPEDIPKLVAPLVEGRADCVTASRFKNPDYRPEMPPAKFWGNHAMSLLISFLTNQKYYDVSCGFRAYTRDTLLRMNLFGRFTYTQESFIDLAYKHISMMEVPIQVRGEREFGKSRVASNLFRYAVSSSKIIFRSFVDYRPILVFGGISLVFFSVSFLLALFLGIHWARTGMLTPHKWAGFTSAFLAGIGMLSLITSIMADMLGRIRMNQERILYNLRKGRARKTPAGLFKVVGATRAEDATEEPGGMEAADDAPAEEREYLHPRS